MDKEMIMNAVRLSQLDPKLLAGFAVGLLEMLYPDNPRRVNDYIERILKGDREKYF